MTNEEAKEFLNEIADELGFIYIEYRTFRDGDKMREAIKVLSQESLDHSLTVGGKVFDTSKARIKTYDKLGEYTLCGFYEKESREC